MKKRKASDLSMLIVLLLLNFLALFYFSESDYSVIGFCVLIISAVVMHFLSSEKNFVWLLGVLLTMGFGTLLIADSSVGTQLQLIKEYLLLATALIMIWLIYNEAKQLTEHLLVAQAHAKELEKYIGSSEVLTFSEFMTRVAFISTGTKRRLEENFYLRFRLTTSALSKDAFENVFSKTILSTTRTQFDLVTKMEDGSYVVFLQNTNREGCSIVLDRLFKALSASIKTDTVPVDVEILDENQSQQYIGQFKKEN